MILQENGTRFCTEGKVFTIGGIICANDESEYAGLCGTVMEIRSGDDCETENDTPDIYCAFDPPASEDMVLELEDRLSALYGEPKTMDDITLDSVIMAPEMLEPSAEQPAEGVDLSGRRWLIFLPRRSRRRTVLCALCVPFRVLRQTKKPRHGRS